MTSHEADVLKQMTFQLFTSAKSAKLAFYYTNIADGAHIRDIQYSLPSPCPSNVIYLPVALFLPILRHRSPSQCRKSATNVPTFTI